MIYASSRENNSGEKSVLLLVVRIRRDNSASPQCGHSSLLLVFFISPRSHYFPRVILALIFIMDVDNSEYDHHHHNNYEPSEEEYVSASIYNLRGGVSRRNKRIDVE